jgi:hypothetical protein
MKNRHSILVVLFLALGMGWGQDSSGPAPSSSDAQTRTEPAPALGPAPISVQLEENPPISGLDQPSLEPRAAARSFLLPSVVVSQSVDSNVGGSTGESAVHGATRGFGSLTLERLWSKYATALDYVGGGVFFSGGGRRNALVQELQAYQRIAWRTGQLSIRDSFSYLPEGSFGYGTYGGASSYQSGLPYAGPGGGLSGGGFGAGAVFGGGQFGSLGQEPRISNVALAELIEALNPRSSVTVAGAYALTHYTDNSVLVNGSSLDLINNRQTTVEAAYNYQLGRHDQVGVLYGFQHFQYPLLGFGDFTTHLWHLLYGHRISGRMDFMLGGGPQLVILSNPGSTGSQRLQVSGRASLRYRLRRGEATLSYSRLTTSGSGFFLGATSDIARVSLSEPLTRQWNAIADIGYAHNSRIQPGGSFTSANSYGYVYAGASARRKLGRNFDFFLSYQFNDLTFDSSFCGTTGHCNRAAQRHVATVGLDWHPHPIRLD